MMTGSQTSEQHQPNQQPAFQNPMSGIGIYPYSHLGHGGRLPGVNGNVSRSSQAGGSMLLKLSCAAWTSSGDITERLDGSGANDG